MGNPVTSSTSRPVSSGTLRQSAGPLRLLKEAVGGPRQVQAKARRFVRTMRLYGDADELERRLTTLQERGYIERRPTRAQLIFGALDMVRFVIVPAARDYYESQGIDFNFHQVLRFLDDPVSVIDPTGFLSERDTIIGHVMQVVHLNPIYDLQLLEMFPDGLDRLEADVAAMVDGTHERAGTIGAIVEDPAYHGRLLEYVRNYRRGERPADMVRPSTLRDDPHFVAAERTFAALPGFVDYCAALPTSPVRLLARHRRTKRFPMTAEIRPRET